MPPETEKWRKMVQLHDEAGVSYNALAERFGYDGAARAMYIVKYAKRTLRKLGELPPPEPREPSRTRDACRMRRYRSQMKWLHG
jgi:hypothetical protein